MGIFNGELRPEEVFPFPETLTEEQSQNTAMFLDPVEKFYEVCTILVVSKYNCINPVKLVNTWWFVPQEVNDAAKNDQMETVPPEVMKGLGEMGAFGMQVGLMEFSVVVLL